ncbi:MAG: FAD-binding oxidoreductase [Terriglobia bacterium]
MVGEAAIQELKNRLRGELLLPVDDGYEAARKIFNAMFDKRPALIVRCAGTGDVIHSVQFAREQGPVVSVRAGGHSLAGKSVCDDGLMIDLSRMKGIRVDPIRRTARAEPGPKLGEFDRETQAFGLATTLGVASITGIAGLTLGGGYGWLAGKFGLACDNLLSVDVVTAEGRWLTASASENEDLFWGIRGGGGNFGIVTSFEYQLHPVGPVLGGMVLYPLNQAKEVLPLFHEFSSTAPDEVSTVSVLLTGPDGNPAVAAAACYCGPLDQGEKVLKPLRTLGSPLADLIAPRPYAEMQTLVDEMYLPGRFRYEKASNIRHLSDVLVEVLVAYVRTKPTPLSHIYLQQLHGAASRVGASETAFPHRYDHYQCGVHGASENPADSEKITLWARECWQALQPFAERAVYANVLGPDEDDRVRAAVGPNYDRLVALKNKYDPTNFFHFNQNIKPTV